MDPSRISAILGRDLIEDMSINRYGSNARMHML